MSAFPPALDAALAAPQATIFGAIQMELPGRTVRLLVGSGFVDFAVDGAVQRFTGKDDVIGVFSAIDTLTDGLGDTAPALTLTFVPASDAAVGALAAVAMQGSRVRLWLGAVDPATGLVIGVSDPLFDGLLDVATVKLGTTGRTVDYEVTSIFGDFFIDNSGNTLSDSFHQYVWPGELGCSFVSYVTHQVYWGIAAPSGVTL